jgi:hypothetical protein
MSRLPDRRDDPPRRAGYWLVAGDVFGFGTPFHGSASGLTSAAAAVAVAHD